MCVLFIRGNPTYVFPAGPLDHGGRASCEFRGTSTSCPEVDPPSLAVVMFILFRFGVVRESNRSQDTAGRRPDLNLFFLSYNIREATKGQKFLPRAINYFLSFPGNRNPRESRIGKRQGTRVPRLR